MLMQLSLVLLLLLVVCHFTFLCVCLDPRIAFVFRWGHIRVGMFGCLLVAEWWAAQ